MAPPAACFPPPKTGFGSSLFDRHTIASKKTVLGLVQASPGLSSDFRLIYRFMLLRMTIKTSLKASSCSFETSRKIRMKSR